MKKNIFIIMAIVCGLIGCKQSKRPAVLTTELIEVRVSETTENHDINSWIEPYRKTLKKFFDVPIGFSAIDFEKKRPESLVGNMLIDGVEWYSMQKGKKFDFVVLNYGGIRADLNKGDITVGEVFEIHPFDNSLVILELKGVDVDSLCRTIAIRGGEVTRGISFELMSYGDKKYGENFKINGLPIDTSLTYKVLSSDYLSYGNDQMTSLANYVNIYNFNVNVREVIIDYIKNEFKNGRMISPKLNNEIVEK